MKIKVTKEHINKGEKHDACKCPIALAVCEALGRTIVETPIGHMTYPVEVDNSILVLREDENVYDDYPINEEIYNFIGNFDAGQQVEPFEFDLERV